MDLRRIETKTPFLNGFIDNDTGRRYGRTDLGNVALSGLVPGQVQYVAPYLDGDIGEGLSRSAPNLGMGLVFEGDSRDYHTMAVRPEDAEELLARLSAYFLLRYSVVPDGKERDPSDAEKLKAEAKEFLHSRDLPTPKEWYARDEAS